MRILFPLVLLAMSAAPAAAAERSYTVTDYDRVRIEGPFRVTLATGRAPFARASGSPAAIDRLSVEVQGRTLVIRQNRLVAGGSGANAGPVEIRLGAHELTSAEVNGSGSLEIDRVRAMKFSLSVNGAGSAELGAVDADRLTIGIQGSAVARVAGKALTMTAIAQGAGLLDASALSAKDATIGASGPAKVMAIATGTAKVTAMGAAMVELQGRPACTNRVEGSAIVSGCR